MGITKIKRKVYDLVDFSDIKSIIVCEDIKRVLKHYDNELVGFELETLNEVIYSKNDFFKKYDKKLLVSRYAYTYDDNGNSALAIVLD